MKSQRQDETPGTDEKEIKMMVRILALLTYRITLTSVDVERWMANEILGRHTSTKYIRSQWWTSASLVPETAASFWPRASSIWSRQV